MSDQPTQPTQPATQPTQPALTPEQLDQIRDALQKVLETIPQGLLQGPLAPTLRAPAPAADVHVCGSKCF
jgi:hypothetical protein